MTIGIDASRAFTKSPTGTENYSYHLIEALANLECQEKFILFARDNLKSGVFTKDAGGARPAPTDGVGIEPFGRIESLSVGATHEPPSSVDAGRASFQMMQIPWSWLWTQGGLASETWQQKLDVLFIPAHVIPFLKKPSLPVVTTVHDLPPEFFPYQKTLLQRLYLSRPIEYLRTILATKIIAVSKATKEDLVKKLGVDSSKVTVVYEGVDADKFKITTQNSKFGELKKKYGIDGDYFLFVGTLQPRKNLVRLIEGFSQFIKSFSLNHSNPSYPFLLIAGQKGWDYQETLAAPQKFGVGDWVKFLDYVDFADLPTLYANSLSLVFPSLYEGFGLPILEAYSAGTLVLTSNASSLPEVAGEEGIYVNPLDVSDIARGLAEVVKISQNFDLRAQKIVLSQKWAGTFTWERTAKETLAVLKSAASASFPTSSYGSIKR